MICPSQLNTPVPPFPNLERHRGQVNIVAEIEAISIASRRLGALRGATALGVGVGPDCSRDVHN